MIKDRAIETLQIEAAAVENLIPRIDDDFVKAVEDILELFCQEWARADILEEKLPRPLPRLGHLHFLCTLPKPFTAI